MREMFDVIVIGAGPAGLTAAIRLRQSRWKVLLVDKAVFPREKVCGGFIGPENLELLREMNVYDTLLERGAKEVRMVELSASNGAASRFPVLHRGRRATALAASRLLLDHTLMERARELGVQVVDGSTATEQPEYFDGMHAFIVRKNQDGFQKEIYANQIIRANGAIPYMAESADFLGVAAVYQGVEDMREDVFLHFMEDGHLGLNRYEDGLTNVCYVAHRDILSACGNDLESVLARFKRENPRIQKQLGRALRVTPWKGIPVSSRPHFQFHDGKGFFAGDAVAAINPVVGGGISAAMTGADILVRELVRYAPHNLSFAEAATNYERAWKRQFYLSFRLSYLWARLSHRKSAANFIAQLLHSNELLSRTIFYLHHKPFKQNQTAGVSL